MKKYLSKFLVLVALFVLVLLLFNAAVYWSVRNYPMALPANKNILIVGDSHTECAINDTIFARSHNLSSSGNHYFGTYFKIKRILADNPQIDTVVLSFFTTSLEANPRWRLAGFFSKYTLWNSPATFTAELTSIYSWPRIAKYWYAEATDPDRIKIMAKRLTGKPLSTADLGMGGYMYLVRDKLQEDIDRQTTVPLPCQIDTTTQQFRYLRRIEALCRDKGVALILLNAPVYDADKFTERRKFAQKMVNSLPEFTYVDLSNVPLADSCYGDIAHLNYRGAVLFSRYLQSNGIVPLPDSLRYSK